MAKDRRAEFVVHDAGQALHVHLALRAFLPNALIGSFHQRLGDVAALDGLGIETSGQGHDARACHSGRAVSAQKPWRQFGCGPLDRRIKRELGVFAHHLYSARINLRCGRAGRGKQFPCALLKGVKAGRFVAQAQAFAHLGKGFADGGGLVCSSAACAARRIPVIHSTGCCRRVIHGRRGDSSGRSAWGSHTRSLLCLHVQVIGRRGDVRGRDGSHIRHFPGGRNGRSPRDNRRARGIQARDRGRGIHNRCPCQTSSPKSSSSARCESCDRAGPEGIFQVAACKQRAPRTANKAGNCRGSHGPRGNAHGFCCHWPKEISQGHGRYKTAHAAAGKLLDCLADGLKSLLQEKLWQACSGVDRARAAAALEHPGFGWGDVSQHGVAVATVAGDRLGNGFQLRDAAFGKSLHARGSGNHLVHCHVQGSKEVGVKLLRQDVVRHALGQELLTQLVILLWVGQNLIDQIVQGVQLLGGDVQAAKLFGELGHGLGINLGSACQHLVGKFLRRNLLAHLFIDRHFFRIWALCGHFGRHRHLLGFHSVSLRRGRLIVMC